MLIDGDSWNQGEVRVASRDNVEVKPHQGWIGSYPWIENVFIYLQFEQPDDENADSPGRYRPARSGILNPTGYFVVGGGSWNAHGARVVPRNNAEVPPHPRWIRSHLRVRNPSISLQFQQSEDENTDPTGRYRPRKCGNPNPTGRLLFGWGSWSQHGARVAPRDNA